MDRNLIPRPNRTRSAVTNSSPTTGGESSGPSVGGNNEYGPTNVYRESFVSIPRTIRLSELRPLRSFDIYSLLGSIPISTSAQPEEGNSRSDIHQEPLASPSTPYWTTPPQRGDSGALSTRELASRHRNLEATMSPPPAATPLSRYPGDFRQAEPLATIPGPNPPLYGRRETFEVTRTTPTPPVSPLDGDARDTRGEIQAIEAHHLGSLLSDEFADSSRNEAAAGEIRRSPTRRATRNPSRGTVEFHFFFEGFHTLQQSVGMVAIINYIRRQALREILRRGANPEDLDPVPPYTRQSSRTIGHVGDYGMENTDEAINPDVERLIDDNLFRSMATGQNSDLADELEEMRIQDSENLPAYRETEVEIQAYHRHPHRLNGWLTRWSIERTWARGASMGLVEAGDGGEDTVYLTREWMTPGLQNDE